MIVMIVAGVLLGANLCGRPQHPVYETRSRSVCVSPARNQWFPNGSGGWELKTVAGVYEERQYRIYEKPEYTLYGWPFDVGEFPRFVSCDCHPKDQWKRNFSTERIVYNVWIAVLILTATAFICELLLPRLTRIFKRG